MGGLAAVGGAAGVGTPYSHRVPYIVTQFWVYAFATGDTLFFIPKRLTSIVQGIKIGGSYTYTVDNQEWEAVGPDILSSSSGNGTVVFGDLTVNGSAARKWYFAHPSGYGNSRNYAALIDIEHHTAQLADTAFPWVIDVPKPGGDFVPPGAGQLRASPAPKGWLPWRR